LGDKSFILQVFIQYKSKLQSGIYIKYVYLNFERDFGFTNNISSRYSYFCTTGLKES
jgi:hypothetical protein